MSLDAEIVDAIKSNELPRFKELMSKRIEEIGLDALNKELCDEAIEHQFNICRPLALAAGVGAVDICKHLCELGADPTLANPHNPAPSAHWSGRSPLWIAANEGKFEVVKLLFDSDKVSITREILVAAIDSNEGKEEDRKKTINYLLDRYPNIWEIDYKGETILHNWARSTSHSLQCLKLLDSIMTERKGPIDYQRQVAVSTGVDGNNIVYTLPVLAALFEAIGKISIVPEPTTDSTVTDQVPALEIIHYLLTEKKLDPTIPIKFGEYKGVSPLDLLCDAVMTKRTQVKVLFNIILTDILTIRPELLFHVVLQDHDQCILSLWELLSFSGDHYKEAIQKGLENISNEKIYHASAEIQVELFQAMMPDRSKSYLEYLSAKTGDKTLDESNVNLEVPTAAEAKTPAAATPKRVRDKDRTKDDTSEKTARGESFAQAIGALGFRRRETRQTDATARQITAEIAVPAAAKGTVKSMERERKGLRR